MLSMRQGTTLFTAMMALIGLMVLIQIWLLTASIDAFRYREFKMLIPAAIASTALLCVNAGLLRYLFGFDRDLRREGHHE